jgi:chemotaxis protein histidine kinase CheA
LKEVEFSLVMPNGELQRRYLNFTFERVLRDGEVHQLLVTVQDITLSVKLTKELRESSIKMERQAQLLMSVLHVEPTSLQDFLRDARARLEHISGILRKEIEENIRPVERQQRYKQQVAEMLREIHRVKGNAAVLHIAYYENAAHDFETRLTELADRPALDGKDFLPVVVELSAALHSLQEMSEVVTKLIATYGRNEINPGIVKGFGSEFSGYALNLAQKLGKKALYSATLDPIRETTPALQQALKALLIQFIRNSMTHGIESPEQRRAAGKPETGRIEVWADVSPQRIRVVYQDDGAGLDYDRLIERVKALETTEPGLMASLIDPEKNEWKMAELGSIIFRPGVTTATEVTEDMGRGAGLDLVKTQVEALGGTVSVLSQSGINCLFVLDFPPGAGEGMEAPI